MECIVQMYRWVIIGTTTRCIVQLCGMYSPVVPMGDYWYYNYMYSPVVPMGDYWYYNYMYSPVVWNV